jgi:HEAT repeat protein
VLPEFVRAVGELPDCAERSVPLLITYLEQGNPNVQIAAAEALGNLGPRAHAAIPALAKLGVEPALNLPQHWDYVLSSEKHRAAVSRASLTDAGRMQVSELAAIPVGDAARAALQRIEGGEPVEAPRPE